MCCGGLSPQREPFLNVRKEHVCRFTNSTFVLNNTAIVERSCYQHHDTTPSATHPSLAHEYLRLLECEPTMEARKRSTSPTRTYQDDDCHHFHFQSKKPLVLVIVIRSKPGADAIPVDHHQSARSP